MIRKCKNCNYFPCSRKECDIKNLEGCKSHKFESEKIIKYQKGIVKNV